MKHLFTLLFFYFTFYTASAQVGIGTSTPDPAAALDITSTDKGLLIPRVTLANRPGSPGKAAPTPGLMIYQTDNEPGFYVYDGTNWERLVKKSEAAPHSVAYSTLELGSKDHFLASSGGGTPITLKLKASTPDIIGDPYNYSLTLTKAGTYSIDFAIEPNQVSGNTFSVGIYVNYQSVYQSGVSTLSDFKFQGTNIVVTVEANSRVELRVAPSVSPGNITPSALYFPPNKRGAYMKITQIL